MLTTNQLRELDALFEIVSQRQLKDFGNITASNKLDGSLITTCDLWSDKTIVDGLNQRFSEKEEIIPSTEDIG